MPPRGNSIDGGDGRWDDHGVTVPEGVTDPVDRVRRYFDTLAEGEWDRLHANPAGRASLEIHRRFLARFVPPGGRVLEVGAGPGRFTIELARLGARVVVTDVSPVQLALNARYVAAAGAQHAVEEREVLDLRDTRRYPEGAFDAVVAYGGPLSYLFEAEADALSGLFRVTRRGGAVVASVMSLVGVWRHLLPEVLATFEENGQDALRALWETGDTRPIITDGSHVCRMFRFSGVIDLVRAAGGRLVAASASNWASLGDPRTVAAFASDTERWAEFLDFEEQACAEPGAVDGGTHLLFAATRA